jgi:hypothetical protein
MGEFDEELLGSFAAMISYSLLFSVQGAYQQRPVFQSPIIVSMRRLGMI